jgi:hypothetical protein
MTTKTTPASLFEAHIRTCSEALEIIKRKNADYGADEDALKNFRLVEQLGIPMPIGILTRLADKLARLGKIITTGKQAVMDETVDDTILDMINYAIILKAALHEIEDNHEENIYQSTGSKLNP